MLIALLYYLLVTQNLLFTICYGHHLLYSLGRKLCIAVVLNLPMLQPFNTVFHVVVNPRHKIISLLLHSGNFATVMNIMNHNVNI